MADPATDSSQNVENSEVAPPARIVVIGTGWWGQGWHLPHLHRNPNSVVAAIVDTNPNPTSSLNPKLKSLQALGEEYSAPIFNSVEALIEAQAQLQLDGVVVSTPHATHASIGKALLQVPGLHVLLEKPFTTDVAEAHELCAAAKVADDGRSSGSGRRLLLVNHSANSRAQCALAADACPSLGEVQHVTAFMGSALLWLFEDAKQPAWTKPSGSMLGNGFGWGQMSHLLAFIYRVTQLEPRSVTCTMVASPVTGADIHNSAVITCTNGATISLSGTAAVPGNEHAKTQGLLDAPKVGKLIDVKVFGSLGCLLYGGNDSEPSSGQLERRLYASGGAVEVLHPQFHFENCEDEGIGPESLQSFVAGCQGQAIFEGASFEVGLQAVRTIDAMYRSHAKKGQPVDVV